jgi:hypothetical protein
MFTAWPNICLLLTTTVDPRHQAGARRLKHKRKFIHQNRNGLLHACGNLGTLDKWYLDVHQDAGGHRIQGLGMAVAYVIGLCPTRAPSVFAWISQEYLDRSVCGHVMHQCATLQEPRRISIHLFGPKHCQCMANAMGAWLLYPGLYSES